MFIKIIAERQKANQLSYTEWATLTRKVSALFPERSYETANQAMSADRYTQATELNQFWVITNNRDTPKETIADGKWILEIDKEKYGDIVLTLCAQMKKEQTLSCLKFRDHPVFFNEQGLVKYPIIIHDRYSPDSPILKLLLRLQLQPEFRFDFETRLDSILYQPMGRYTYDNVETLTGWIHDLKSLPNTQDVQRGIQILRSFIAQRFGVE